MGAYNARVLKQGAYAYSLNWPGSFASASDAVSMALSAKLVGLFVKCTDGNAGALPSGTQNWKDNLSTICPPALAAGLEVIPWACIYPTDTAGSQAIANIVQAVKQSGSETVLLEPVMSPFAKATANTAARALHAIAAALPGVTLTYCTWGAPYNAGAFPFAQFDAVCRATLPELYYADYTKTFGTPDNIWGQYWNWIEKNGQNPVSVIPTFDFPEASRFMWLARNEGAPTVSWWLLDSMTPAVASTLAASSYARTVTPPKAAASPTTSAAGTSTLRLQVASALSTATELVSDLSRIKNRLGG